MTQSNLPQGVRLKYLPSVRVVREPGESVVQLIDRVLADSRCTPDQRGRLLAERDPTGFDDLCHAIWLEQAPVEIPT